MMVWTLVSYVLDKLSSVKGNVIPFRDLSNFVFDILWVKYNVALVDSEGELRDVLDYLAKLKIVEIVDNNIIIKDRERLKRIAVGVEKAPIRSVSRLYDEMIRRINDASKELAASLIVDR